MKKVITIILASLMVLAMFVACDANTVETVFENKTAEYAKLVGTELKEEDKGADLAKYNFGEKIAEAVEDFKSQAKYDVEPKYRYTIEFLAEQTLAPSKYIISTEDSPALAWVEVEEANDKSIAKRLNILIKTNAKKFLANECCISLFNSGFDDFEYVEKIKFNNVFDTSETTSMIDMFSFVGTGTSPVIEFEELDLSCFDTSKVTDMKYLIYSAKINSIKLGPNFIIGADTNIDSFAEDFQGSKITGPEAALRALNANGSGSALEAKNGWSVTADGNNSTLTKNN